MMRKLFFLMSVLMFCAIPVFAQDQGGAAGGGHNIWIPVAAGLGMALASGLCGIGQGMAIAIGILMAGEGPQLITLQLEESWQP